MTPDPLDDQELDTFAFAIETAVGHVTEYRRPEDGGQTYDDRRTVRMIVIEDVLARLGPRAVAELRRLRVEGQTAQAKETELRTLCGELLESLRLASTTSDGHRDAHAAYQRWAARLAPDAIGDEAKRAAIEAALPAIPKVSTSVLDEMLASLEAKEVPLADVEISASTLRALSEEYDGSDRPPLTEEHRAALRTLLVDAKDDLVQLEHLAKTRDVSHTLALARAQVAALRAVLGDAVPHQTPEEIGPHEMVGDYDCERCGESMQYYLHTDRDSGEEPS